MNGTLSSAEADRFDILVAGAGPVGLTAAIVCAQAGFSTCLVGRDEPAGAGRTVALMQGALELYDSLGLTPAIEAASAPLASMRLVDVTDSPFRSRPVEFKSTEIGLEAFGRNISNDDLTSALRAHAGELQTLSRIDGLIDSYSFSKDFVHASVGERRVEARLAVAADGRKSAARAAAGIKAHMSAQNQIALTALLAHDAPHGDASTEFHTRGGPFTLVPMPPGPNEPHRSSLVWMMTPAEARKISALDPIAFARAVEARSGRFLGAMRLIGAIGSTPIACLRVERLVGPRLLLAGDAAHGLPPIGAQGLNLSLRDIASFTKLLKSGPPDPGAEEVLSRYESGRRRDVWWRTTAVDALNRSLTTASPAADLLRGMGFLALNGIAPIRRLAMRAGLGPIEPSSLIAHGRRGASLRA